MWRSKLPAAHMQPENLRTEASASVPQHTAFVGRSNTHSIPLCSVSSHCLCLYFFTAVYVVIRLFSAVFLAPSQARVAMEPLATLSLVSNIAQLIDLAGRVIAKGLEVAKSGSTVEHERLKMVVTDFSDLSARITKKCSKEVQQRAVAVSVDQALPIELQATITSEDDALWRLGQTSTNVADELTSLLESLTLEKNSRKRKRDIVRSTAKSMWRQSDVDRLREEFSRLQQELNLRQCFIIKLVITLFSPESQADNA